MHPLGQTQVKASPGGRGTTPEAYLGAPVAPGPRAAASWPVLSRWTKLMPEDPGGDGFTHVPCQGRDAHGRVGWER